MRSTHDTDPRDRPSLPMSGRSTRPAAAATDGLRVLVVEDDPGIAGSLILGLTRAGYSAHGVTTGRAAVETARTPEVVLLDLGLPDMDGIGLCRGLRDRSDAVIIVISSRGDEDARVAALDAGADDYLVKPFGLVELLARIRAVLRRARDAEPQLLRHGPLTLVPSLRKVTLDGCEVALTPKEFDILARLTCDPGRVVSRLEILESVWDAHWYGPMKVLDVHIASLRRKLGVPGLVETVYGRGFRLGTAADPHDRGATCVEEPAPSPRFGKAPQAAAGRPRKAVPP